VEISVLRYGSLHCLLFNGNADATKKMSDVCVEEKPIDHTKPLSNGEIASELMTLAQFLAARRENPFKVKAYRRAARTIRALGESVDELARSGADLTQFPGVGPAISGVIQEIVRTGTLRQLEKIRSEVPSELLEISQHPRLDPRRVLRIYKKLGISSIAALKESLDSGEIRTKFGAKLAQHIRQGLIEIPEMLSYEADSLVSAIRRFLLNECKVRRAEPIGDYRRRVETVTSISFLVETENWASVIARLQRFGGRAELLERTEGEARLQLSSGTLLKIVASSEGVWGRALISGTGSEAHVRALKRHSTNWKRIARAEIGFETEDEVYRELGLTFIPPELREGRDEIALSERGEIPTLVSSEDICGELHAHSTSSDGVHTVEEMTEAAKEVGYEYLGMSDHSQSLKIAGGLSEEDLWNQIRFIEKLNMRLTGIRVLKSAEVDILLDGALDYPDELLKELDYTVCSIHSRFGLGKAEQTDRILRAMDNRYFNILGHATGRLLLKRPGYEIDIERVIEHARLNGCFFEINSSPDRLDLSAENARLARDAGVKIAITTDAHSIRDFGYLRYGVDQARRAGFDRDSVLNHLPWARLERILKR
jgi:DNA polymerase (family 10)